MTEMYLSVGAMLTCNLLRKELSGVVLRVRMNFHLRLIPINWSYWNFNLVRRDFWFISSQYRLHNDQ